MKKDSRYIWYLIDVIVFLTINFLILRNFGNDIYTSISDLSWFHLLIIALGIYRLTDIITYENVTEFIRAPFMDKKVVDNKEVWEISGYGFRGFWGTLMSCNACMGVWVSMIVVYLYLFLPTPTFIFLFIMSLTGFERFFSKFYNFLEKRG